MLGRLPISCFKGKGSNMAVLSHAEAIAAQREKTAVLDVLVVDPKPESRALLKSALRSVEIVKNVRETGSFGNIGQILSESRPQVILVEHELGEVDVFQVVKKLRAHPVSKGTNFVLMSSEMNTDLRAKGMEVGIQGFLSKPFDILGIESALRDAMAAVSTNHKETLDRIRKVAFFSGFTDKELVRLLKICHTKKLSPGSYLFREGDRGDRLFVLVGGNVEIVKEREEGPEVLVTMVPGNVFGEMAIVDSEPRSADARAKDQAMVIEVNAEIINDGNDILALKIFRMLAILVTKKLRNYTN